MFEAPVEVDGAGAQAGWVIEAKLFGDFDI